MHSVEEEEEEEEEEYSGSINAIMGIILIIVCELKRLTQ